MVCLLHRKITFVTILLSGVYNFLNQKIQTRFIIVNFLIINDVQK